MLHNDLIQLRALEPEDLDLLYTIENEPRLWHVSNKNVPYSRYMLRAYIAHTQHDVYMDGNLRLVICPQDTQTCIGLIDITSIDMVHRRAEVGVALLQCARGKGYASAALSLVEDYCKDYLHLLQLTAAVIETNTESRNLFVRAGYQHTATLPKWYLIEGEAQDLYQYQKFFEKI